jgi:hypothetical protein
MPEDAAAEAAPTNVGQECRSNGGQECGGRRSRIKRKIKIWKRTKSRIRRKSRTLDQEGGDDGSAAGGGVEVDEDDLLVFAGHEFAVGKGDGEAGADE